MTNKRLQTCIMNKWRIRTLISKRTNPLYSLIPCFSYQAKTAGSAEVCPVSSLFSQRHPAESAGGHAPKPSRPAQPSHKTQTQNWRLPHFPLSKRWVCFPSIFVCLHFLTPSTLKMFTDSIILCLWAAHIHLSHGSLGYCWQTFVWLSCVCWCYLQCLCLGWSPSVHFQFNFIPSGNQVKGDNV